MVRETKHCWNLIHTNFTIYWSLWRQLSWKKSLLVICKVLRMFVNILTAAHNCFLLNRGNLRQPIPVILFQEQKPFSEYFSAILKSRLNFQHFQKKRSLTQLMYLWNYGLRKMWLHKSLKNPVSEDPWTSNMVCSTKHCWNLNRTNFLIFIDHCERNWVEKICLSDMQSLKNVC